MPDSGISTAKTCSIAAGPPLISMIPRGSNNWIETLGYKDWYVYAKPPFGGPDYVLGYLGRYTHRMAISNHRITAFDGEKVRFRWRDYRHGGIQRVMLLDAVEFLRRFFLHVLPGVSCASAATAYCRTASENRCCPWHAPCSPLRAASRYCFRLHQTAISGTVPVAAHLCASSNASPPLNSTSQA